MLPSYNFDPNIWLSDQNQESMFPTSMQNYNHMAMQMGALQRHGNPANNYNGPLGIGNMPWGNYSSRNGIPNNISNIGQSEGRTLFIGNLAESMTVQALEFAFRKYGKITQVKCFTARHYGLVTFATEKEAIWAKAQTDSMMLEGREMRVSFGKFKNPASEEAATLIQQHHNNKINNNNNNNNNFQQLSPLPLVSSPQGEPQEERDPPASSTGIKTIFVGNLTFTITSEMLETFFKQFGEITSVRLMSEKHYGFVTFASSEDAETAKQYATGANLDGRPLRINFGKS
jgi:RNA recognition motif-containing protein